MNVAGDISWDRAFAPAPFVERLGKEFEFSARSGKAALDLSIDSHAGKTTPLFIAVRAGNRDYIWRRWLRRPGEHAPEMVFANVVKFRRGNVLIIKRAGLLFDFECAVATHEFKRRKIFRSCFLWQTRNRVLEDPA